MKIRPTEATDLDTIYNIHQAAFGPEEGPEIVTLVRNLLADATARPCYSLMALEGSAAVGHVLFTRAHIEGPATQVQVQLLAPLAVCPEAQKTGIGARLITAGLAELKQAGVDLVFVLGHPGYYPRCGFTPAGVLGFDAPYPIPEKDAAAWMVQDLGNGAMDRLSGKLRCAEALDRPEYWRE